MNNVAEITIAYSAKVKPSERPKVTGSKTAFEVIVPYFNPYIEHREAIFAILLDRGNKVMGVVRIAEGGCNGTTLDPKILFQVALKANASGIILAHNHPSGNAALSQADLDITKKIKQGGVILEIPLLDHLILLPENKYVSMADEGAL